MPRACVCQDLYASAAEAGWSYTPVHRNDTTRHGGRILLQNALPRPFLEGDTLGLVLEHTADDTAAADLSSASVGRRAPPRAHSAAASWYASRSFFPVRCVCLSSNIRQIPRTPLGNLPTHVYKLDALPFPLRTGGPKSQCS